MTHLPAALPALIRALVDRRLWWGVGLALVAISLAYQINPPYLLDVGGPDDCPYFGVAIYCSDGGHSGTPHWGSPERAPADGPTYRWTKAQSELVLPGLGNAPWAVTLRLAGGRVALLPSPVITVTINGQPFTWQTTPGYTERTFPVDRGRLTGGDLTVVLQSPTFTPPNDTRTLGVAVDWLRVTPTGGFVPVLPSLGTTVALVTALLLVFGLVYSVTGGPLPALVAAGGGLVVFLVLLVTRRPELGLFAPQLVRVLVVALALVWSVLGWGTWRRRSRI